MWHESLPVVTEPFSDAELALSFRRALPVEEIVYFTRSQSAYPRCPRCQSTLEREYVCFCDRCGQRLGWDRFSRALIRLTP